MTARIFISYRTSDGADKATALARELGQRFGDRQVFLDKDDLAGGSRWRDVIRETLDGRPVLLVLVTPQYLEARDAEGRLRIERPDDPVRAELATAVEAGAAVIPVLCDGVAAVPRLDGLPPPFGQLGELTWRRLRVYDWRNDVARLVEDLERLGIVGASMPAAPAPPRRGLVLAAGGALLLAAAGAGGWWWWQDRRANDLSGPWTLLLAPRGATTVQSALRLPLRLEQDGARLRLSSAPVNVERDADWAAYRATWKELRGEELKRVVYRGEGEAEFDAGAPGSVRIDFAVETPFGDSIDGGELRGIVGERGLRVRGKLWLNSEQANRVMERRRGSP